MGRRLWTACQEPGVGGPVRPVPLLSGAHPTTALSAATRVGWGTEPWMWGEAGEAAGPQARSLRVSDETWEPGLSKSPETVNPRR